MIFAQYAAIDAPASTAQPHSAVKTARAGIFLHLS